MTNLIQQQVMQASQQWIANFNQGKFEACINTYSSDAHMQVHPFGIFTTFNEIKEFWLTFANSHPADLVYRNIEIKVLNDKQAILSASWRMNIASGFISKELWTLADDGCWYLTQDDFTVLTQLTAAKPIKERTALLLVDLQNDYFDFGRFPLEQINDATHNALLLLSHFRKEALPIIHIQHIFKDSQAPFFACGSEGVNIHQSVKPIENEIVIVKHQIDSFIDTELDQKLIELGIDKLVVVGAMAQACIQTLCRTATFKGYQCQLVEDAIAAPSLSRKEHNFTGAQLVSANILSLSFGGATEIKTADLINK